MAYSVLIVDDEPLAREAISLRLAGNPAFVVCGQADNGIDALALAADLKPDVIFLDMQMPEQNGIEVARQLCASGPQNIVFITAYDQFAVDAFTVNAIDYLLKPIKDHLFLSTLSRLADRLAAQNSVRQNEKLLDFFKDLPPDHFPPTDTASPTGSGRRRIAIKAGVSTKLLDSAEIEAVVSGKDYVCISVGGDVHVHRSTMADFMGKLPDTFVRCHRSHIVNLDHVQAISQNENQMVLVCTSGAKHPVSRRYRAAVKHRINWPESDG